MQCAIVLFVAGNGGDDIGPAVLESGQHVPDAAGPLDLEAQTRAQPDQVQQIGGDTAKVAVAVEVGNRAAVSLIATRITGCSRSHCSSPAES